MNKTGIRPLYWLQVAGYGVAFLIIYLKFQNPSSRIDIKREGSIIQNLSTVLKEGKLVPRWLVLTLLTGFPYQVLFYVPLFAAQVKGANQFIIGGMSTASTLVFVFFAIPLGHLADTYGRKKVVSVAALLVAMSHIVLVWSPNDYMLLLSAFMSGFNMTVIQSQMAISVDLVPAKYLGSWYGIQGFVRGIIGIVAPILCGYMWDLISPASVFYLLAAVQISALVVLLTVPTEITR